MSDLFQEHKKFIVTYVAGALTFLILWLVIGAMFTSDIDRLKRGITKARQDQSRAVASGLLKKARADAEKADAAHGTLVKAVARIPDRIEGLGDIMLSEKQSAADIYFNSVKERIRSDEVEQCAIRNIDVDQDLGLPDAFPTARRDVDWYLRGLDVVRQFLQIVLKVDKDVLAGGIARLDRIEIATAPKSRPAPGATIPYLAEHKVNFTLVGHPMAIYALVESVARRREDGRFLKLASATVRSLDLPPGEPGRMAKGMDPEDTRRVEARLEVVAVDVRQDGQMKPQGKTAP